MNGDTRNAFLEKAVVRENSPENKFIVVEGVIGVGKTSLARLLRDRWMAQTYFENFEQNPFLTRGFYEDQANMAFNTEIFFLLNRFRQQRDINKQQGLVLSDYLFEKSWIFAQMNLSADDREIFHDTYKSFTSQVRRPDLVVLLQTDLETLLRRIYFRDREFERNLSPAYLENLNDQYYQFFSSYNEAPVLRIQTSGLDFVNDPGDLEKICVMIEDRVKGQVQLSFKSSSSRSGDSRVSQPQEVQI